MDPFNRIPYEIATYQRPTHKGRHVFYPPQPRPSQYLFLLTNLSSLCATFDKSTYLPGNKASDEYYLCNDMNVHISAGEKTHNIETINNSNLLVDLLATIN